MSQPFGTAFRPGRALRHGWWALKQQPLLLLVGAWFAHCGEGGGGGGGGNFDPGSGSGSGSGSGGWDPDDWDPELGVEAADGAWQGLVEAAAGAGLPPLPLAIGGIGGLELAIVAVILGVFLVIGLALWLFKCWWTPGYMRLQHATLRGEGAEGRLLLSGGDKFLSYAGLSLLQGLITVGVLGVGLLPGALVFGPGLYLRHEGLMIGGAVLGGLVALVALVYVGLGIGLARHALVFEDMGAVEALGRSWELVGGNRWGLLFYNIVMGLTMLGFVLLGLLMCCVGVFFTPTIADALIDTGTTESYLLLTRQGAETDAWQAWNADIEP